MEKMKKIVPLILLLSIFLISSILHGCAAKCKITKKERAEISQGCLYGLFMTNAPVNLRLINEFEMKTKKKAGMIMFYTNWGEGFPMEDCIDIVNYGAIPHVTWEPWLKLDDIVKGKKDEYIIEWAKDAKGFGHPFFLRWGHEMDGNWYPWSGAKNNNDASKYIKAYRRIHGIFKDVGANNAIWVWAPMNYSIPDVDWNNAQNYYPGDEYVDWVGIDGYNWGRSQPWSHWTDFVTIFKKRYEEFLGRYPNKPIMIAEFASAEIGGRKGKWVEDAFASIKNDYPNIKAIVWFNINKETDWRLDSSPKALSSFKKVVKDDYFVSNPVKMKGLLKGFILPQDVKTELGPLKVVWEKREIEIIKTDEAVKIDGNLEEWSKANKIILDDRRRIVSGRYVWHGVEDLSAEVSFMWDEKNLFLAAKIFDDLPFINKNKDAKIWDGDSLEITFSTDPNADSERTSFLPTDFQVAFSTGYKSEIKPFNWSWQLFGPVDEVEMIVLPMDGIKGYVIEAKIPIFETFGLKLKEGLEIDFDVAVNDADEKGIRETQCVWSGDNMFYQQPNMWGKARFVKEQ